MNSRSKKNQNKLNHAIQQKKTKACTFINPTEKKQITPTNNFPSFLFRQTPTFQRSTKIKGLYIKLANVRMKKKMTTICKSLPFPFFLLCQMIKCASNQKLMRAYLILEEEIQVFDQEVAKIKNDDGK
jgi:hypothetical protein